MLEWLVIKEEILLMIIPSGIAVWPLAAPGNVPIQLHPQVRKHCIMGVHRGWGVFFWWRKCPLDPGKSTIKTAGTKCLWQFMAAIIYFNLAPCQRSGLRLFPCGWLTFWKSSLSNYTIARLPGCHSGIWTQQHTSVIKSQGFQAGNKKMMAVDKLVTLKQS